MSLDVTDIRSRFPALQHGVAHFDGPGGAQVPAQVAAAVAETMCAGLANRGTVTGAEQRAEAVVLGARRAMADLVGGRPEGVVFGRSMTQLTYDLARAMAKRWGPGDEVVVTRLDHDANIRPWVDAARTAGATVRWADFDAATGELSARSVEQVLSRRTRLVAVTGASNLLGSRPDVAEIAGVAHQMGAVVHVDGVHLTPHAPVDMSALGADVYACSPYKFFGPHLGVSVADPALLETLHPDKLLPSSMAVPERFELGTLPYELLAGATAAVDFIAGLAPTATGNGSRMQRSPLLGSAPAEDRRARVLAAMAEVEEHEERLFHRLLEGLRAIRAVHLHGSHPLRTPTVLFSVAGRSPAEVHRGLAARGVNAPAGSFYALEAARWMGLGDAGAVRAGLAPYTNADDVDRLVAGVAELA